MTQIKAKVLFRFKTPNESIKATRKSSLNDGIKEVAEIKETMKSAREGVKSSLRQETRAARLLFGTSSNSSELLVYMMLERINGKIENFESFESEVLFHSKLSNCKGNFPTLFFLISLRTFYLKSFQPFIFSTVLSNYM